MIRFILNNKLIETDEPPGMLLLDLIRYREHLTGTKIGCREGDCGACTVLIGERQATGPVSGNPAPLVYRQATSCLTALGNIHQKHVVTIEGLNGPELNFLQRAICEEGATQCGFCTPGFIVSMAGFCLSDKAPTHANAIASIDGNICRCTGYKSIERALARVTNLLNERQEKNVPERVEERSDPVQFAIAKGIIPSWFADISRRLAEISLQPNGIYHHHTGARVLGGGTDLYVQDHAGMVKADLEFMTAREDLKGIRTENGKCVIGGAATVSDLKDSTVIRNAFPHFYQYAKLISSTPIRNIATIAGNFVNASPIGDLSVFFLALNTELTLSNGVSSRRLPLRKFYNGYKQMNKAPEEFIEKLSFDLPDNDTLFHFEKVSKRTCLDIASVNTAIQIRISDNKITTAHLSAGGVNPVPAYLERTSASIIGERPDVKLVERTVEMAVAEIAPISDVRGTAEYKRLLLGNLIKAHFLTLFPHLPEEELL